MENEIMVYEAAGDIQVSRPPDVVLAEATEAAKALGAVLAGKKKKVMMNNEQYLEFEDWQTVGRFYGVTAKVKETAFINYGNAQGFEAKAVAIRADGMEISAAEAMCLNDEEKWRARPKYKYLYILKDGSKSEEDPPKEQIVWVDNPGKPGSKMPKKERTLTGEESVPLFQLRSMAQTRACAKALRNVLAWVVVLAGYRPTPAEELDSNMTHVEDNGKTDKPPIQQPKEKDKEKKESTPDASIPEGKTKILASLIPELLEYCRAEGKEPEDVLKILTLFKGDAGEDVWVHYDKIKTYSGKWLGAVLGKIRKARKSLGEKLPEIDANADLKESGEDPPLVQIDCPVMKTTVGLGACNPCKDKVKCEPYKAYEAEKCLT